MKTYSLSFILFVLFLSNSCSTKVDLLVDEYESATFVYGAINQYDSVSYLRIQKSYLTDGDILDAAQILDSIQFPYKLQVQLKNGNTYFDFDTITPDIKEEGYFSNPPIQLYYHNTLGKLNPYELLELEVINPKTNEIFTSSVYLMDVDQIHYTYPDYNIDFNHDKEIKCQTIPKGKLYDFSIVFHYLEQFPNDPESAVYKSVAKQYPIVLSQHLLGGEELVFPYFEDELYDFLLKNIPPTSDFDRYYGQVELNLKVADNNYYIYSTAIDPNNLVYTDDLGFTNISNGAGVLASRSAVSHYYDMSLITKSKVLRLEGLNFKGGY